jgi:hypothetical protein
MLHEWDAEDDVAGSREDQKEDDRELHGEPDAPDRDWAKDDSEDEEAHGDVGDVACPLYSSRRPM